MDIRPADVVAVVLVTVAVCPALCLWWWCTESKVGNEEVTGSPALLGPGETLPLVCTMLMLAGRWFRDCCPPLFSWDETESGELGAVVRSLWGLSGIVDDEERPRGAGVRPRMAGDDLGTW